jgi:apolipoprotein N-acyltransferase
LIVQGNIAQEVKWREQARVPILRRYVEATREAALAALRDLPPGHRLAVIWPETALPYLVEDDPTLPAQITGAANGAAVAVGLQRIETSAEGTRGWNSLKVYGAAGQELAAYDKHHLVPFGEYIPLGDLAYQWFGLRAFAAQTGAAYTAGAGPKVLDLGAAPGASADVALKVMRAGSDRRPGRRSHRALTPHLRRRRPHRPRRRSLRAEADALRRARRPRRGLRIPRGRRP